MKMKDIGPPSVSLLGSANNMYTYSEVSVYRVYLMNSIGLQSLASLLQTLASTLQTQPWERSRYCPRLERKRKIAQKQTLLQETSCS